MYEQHGNINIKTLKEVYDIIYDGISNKLLGIRSTFYDTVSNGKLSKCGLVEQVSGGNRVVKAIENDMVVRGEELKQKQKENADMFNELEKYFDELTEIKEKQDLETNEYYRHTDDVFGRF